MIRTEVERSRESDCSAKLIENKDLKESVHQEEILCVPAKFLVKGLGVTLKSHGLPTSDVPGLLIDQENLDLFKTNSLF